MYPLRIAICVGLAAAFAQAFEVKGRVLAEEDGKPVAGVRVRLQLDGDSTLTDSAGAFKLDLNGTALRPQGGPSAGGLMARVHAGLLEYVAANGSAARIDLYGMEGRLLRSLAHRPSAAGMQKVGLAPLTASMRGMGWLRLRAEGATEWIRILNLGAGMEPVALVSQSGPSASSPARAASLAKAAIEYLDTLRVEKAGFYPAMQWVPGTAGEPVSFEIVLWKNPSYGIDPAEIEAWKAHLAKPVVSIRVGPFGIGWPEGLSEKKIELADGSWAESWSTSQCLPGPRPKSVRFAYTRQGREYRDTIKLEPLWKLYDSYRVTGVDSLGPYSARYHLAWDWPKNLSALPERDWAEFYLIKSFTEYHSFSLPDLYQTGILHGIEGGDLRYENFDPARGEWIMKGSPGAVTGIKAEFTLARRDDHDLRIVLQDWAQKPQTAIHLSFANTWPEGGLLPAGQALHPQAKAEPATAFAVLEMIPEGKETGLVVKSPWNGSALEWAFPFPLLDTLAFRLKARATDESGMMPVCHVPALSPVLFAIPSPTDTAAHAFEPNETPAQAAPVPMGRWIEAAWDYRPTGDQDIDHYRFQAQAGARISFKMRNPNPEEFIMDQSFSEPGAGSGYIPEPESEAAVEYTIRTSGDQYFDFRPYNLPGGRYSFRIDPLP